MVDRADAGFIRKMLEKVGMRIDMLARMAHVSGVSSSGPRVTATASANVDTYRAVQVLEPYGITSVPPAGSQGLLLCLGGDGAHPVLLSVGSPGTRLAGLADGEMAIHVGSPATGARVVLRANGNIELAPGPGGLVSVVPSGTVTPPLPLARTTDTVAVTSAALLTLKQALTAWVPAAGDGGAALKTALGNFLLISDAAVVQGAGTITGGGTGAVST
jgi:phage gp45-like